MSVSIRGKAVNGAILIVAILVGPTVYSVLMLRRISDLTQVFLSQDAPAGVLVSKLTDTFVRAERGARLSRIDPDFRSGLERDLAEMQKPLETLRVDAEPPVETTIVRLRGAIRRFHDQAIAEQGDAVALDTAESEVREAIKRLSEEIQGVAYQRTQETKSLAEQAAGLTLAATLAGFLVATVLGAILIRSINRPLSDLAAGTERIAAGRFDEKIPIRAEDELGRLADAFNRMAAALGELERMKAEFIATASHGLRTPLACAKGYLSALSEGRQGTIDEAGLHSIHRIEEEVNRVTRFVDQLLDLGRLRAGRLPLSMREVPPAALFTSIGRSFDAIAEENGIRYRIDVEAGLPPRITADPDRLGEALINLLGNAFKYSSPGGDVTLTVRAEDRCVRVEVADTGPGIPREEVPLIFEKYFRGGGVAAEGTGLGLAISREIVERHGGRIWAESEPGAGARFIFKVPFTKPLAEGNESGRLRRPGTGARRRAQE